MQVPYILSFFILFYYYLTFTVAEKYTFYFHSPEGYNATVADCYAAINMIPDGHLEFTGIGSKPLLFRLPDRARSPKMIRLPACFQFGSCEIYVNLRATTRPNFDPTTDAASVFYFHIWPGVRRAAQRIGGRGLPVSRTGHNVAYTEIKVEPEI